MGSVLQHDTFKVLMGPLNEDFPLLVGYVKMRQMGDTVQILVGRWGANEHTHGYWKWHYGTYNRDRGGIASDVGERSGNPVS